MKPNSNIDAPTWIVNIDGGIVRGLNSMGSELRHAFGVIRLVLDQVGYCHVGITDGLNLEDVVLFREPVKLTLCMATNRALHNENYIWYLNM